MKPDIQKLRRNRKLRKMLRSHGVKLAYLFGSQLTPNTTAESDIDIAVHLDSSIDPDKYTDKRIELSTELGRFFKMDADVNVLQEVPLLLRFVATSEGRYIYEEKKEAHVNYEVKVMTDYFDFLPTLNYLNKEYVKKSLQQNRS